MRRSAVGDAYRRRPSGSRTSIESDAGSTTSSALLQEHLGGTASVVKVFNNIKAETRGTIVKVLVVKKKRMAEGIHLDLKADGATIAEVAARLFSGGAFIQNSVGTRFEFTP